MNLGNIKNAQAGDEVCTVEIKDGKLTVCGSISYVKGPNLPNFPQVTFVTRQPGDGNQIGAFTTGEGKMRPGMYPNDYWYSMNPTHIKRAKRIIEKNALAALEKEKKSRLKLQKFRKELAALLKKYNADIYPNQTHGDDQGVEIDLEISIGDISEKL